METLESVIEGCKVGDEAMQAELYRRYSPRFYLLCRRYAPDDDVAQQILVDSFLTIFAEVSHYRGEGAFEGWMQTIVVRQAIRSYKKNQRRWALFEDAEKEDFPYHQPDVGMQMDIREALVRALRLLSEKERRVFNLVAMEEYTLADAAELLKLPESTVKTQYYRAQRILKKRLMKHLGRHYLKN